MEAEIGFGVNAARQRFSIESQVGVRLDGAVEDPIEIEIAAVNGRVDGDIGVEGRIRLVASAVAVRLVAAGILPEGEAEVRVGINGTVA